MITCTAEECTTARLLVALVNTRASENGRPETLGSPAELRTWLETAGLGPMNGGVTPADVLAAHELRDAFVTIFRSHCGCADAPLDAAEAYLSDIARRYPLVPRITAAGCTFEPAQTGVAGAFGALFAAAADVVGRGHWPRLKICKNLSCLAGFIDKTRNTGGQFCSPACGSQTAMRAYRSRIKTAGT